MHEVYNDFLVNGRSWTKIRGPVKWTDPRTGEALQVWIREKPGKSRAGDTAPGTSPE